MSTLSHLVGSIVENKIYTFLLYVGGYGCVATPKTNITSLMFQLLFQVLVHLRDNTTAKGQLLYYQKHYNLALFRVNLDQHVQLPSFNDKVQSDQHIFMIGRDEHFNLAMRYGRVEYSNPSFIDEYHCLSIVGGGVDFKVHLFVVLY